MPPAEAPPPAITDLVDRQGIMLSDTDWARSMQILFEKLRDVVRSSVRIACRLPGDAAGFDRSLAEADRVFQTIRAEAELYLSNAYNGLGSVILLQADAQRRKRQGKQALQWIDKALALVPNHPYALHDRQEALRSLAVARERDPARAPLEE